MTRLASSTLTLTKHVPREMSRHPTCSVRVTAQMSISITEMLDLYLIHICMCLTGKDRRKDRRKDWIKNPVYRLRRERTSLPSLSLLLLKINNLSPQHHLRASTLSKGNTLNFTSAEVKLLCTLIKLKSFVKECPWQNQPHRELIHLWFHTYITY